MAPATSSKSNKKLFLCSFGGKVLPRPTDRKLQYVGGETRIIEIGDDTSWEELTQEMISMYGKPHSIKYQLPELGEDFQCLLLVSCDEELEDMMEYGVVDGGGSGPEELIRLFLFPSDDDGHWDLTMEGDSRTQYISAVNRTVLESKADRGFHSEPSNPWAPAELLNHLSKAEADKSDKSRAPRTQLSGPAALEDGLIEFEKDGELAEALSNPKVENTSPKVEESQGETTSEVLESEIEEDDGLIIDTKVGKIDLRNLQEMDNMDLEVGKVLGFGGFGTVHHGKWMGTDVAIKRIHRSCFTGSNSGKDILILESFKEAGILSTLQHPNIVNLYGFTRDESGNISIVMELVPHGSLRDIFNLKDKYLDHRKRLIIAKGAALGMAHLHLSKIVHFDLKCDNLLVDLKEPSRPICKVTDFGLSKVRQNTMVSGNFRGTLPYMAPELLRRDTDKVSEKVDVFSFGIVMWEIFTGKVPYDGMGPGDIIAGVPDNTLRPHVSPSCDREWKRLMEQCWDCNPKRRPSFNEIARRLNLMLLASHTEAGK